MLLGEAFRKLVPKPASEGSGLAFDLEGSWVPETGQRFVSGALKAVLAFRGRSSAKNLLNARPWHQHPRRAVNGDFWRRNVPCAWARREGKGRGVRRPLDPGNIAPIGARSGREGTRADSIQGG